MAEVGPFRAPRGVQDILPEVQPLWEHVRATARKTATQFGYSQIDTPVFESTSLFQRGVGDETDIVQHEMYSFEDLGGDSLTLRPEGTAPVCRSYIEHGMHNLPQPVRMFYISPMFRYERPQAGRFRQHHQFGCEAIGDASPMIDAEIIEMGWTYITRLGLSDITVKLNSIGDPEGRQAYTSLLKSHFARYENDLPPIDRARLERAPLRLLDSKESATQNIANDAPRSVDFLSPEAAEHWETLNCHLQSISNVYPDFKYRTDHTMVRGFDYYNRTVFEFVPAHEGSQTSLFGGGRYDPLVATLGGQPTPGVGSGSGIERVISEIQRQESAHPPANALDLVIVHLGDEAFRRSLPIASSLRHKNLSVIVAPIGRSMRAQMRYANQCGARYALIIGNREIASGVAALKPLREDSEQVNVQIYSESIADAVSIR